MNDFLIAIHNNLNDNDLRLAYADYLEEQGDPQGEFIRLQIELEKLKKREKQLIKTFNFPKQICCKNGFPYQLNISMKKDFKLLEKYPTISSLKGFSNNFIRFSPKVNLDKIIRLNFKGSYDVERVNFDKFVNLKILILDSCCIDRYLFPIIINKLTNLEKLSLVGNYIHADYKIFDKFNNLKVIDLRKNYGKNSININELRKRGIKVII